MIASETGTVLCSTFSCALAWIDAHGAVIIAAIGVVVAAIAVGFTYWQVSVAQEHNRLSVRPRLFLHVDTGDTPRDHSYVNLSIRNYGLGPAFLKAIEYRVNGKLFDLWNTSERYAALAEIFGERWSEAMRLFWLDGAYAVAKDDTLPIAHVETVLSPIEGDDPLPKLKQAISIVVRYESPYGEQLDCLWPESDRSVVVAEASPAA